MKVTSISLAAAATLVLCGAAHAETDQYQQGDTVLSITQDKFKMEIRDPLVNPGNSLRVYMRPRNGNCTSLTYNEAGKSLKINSDPMCNDSKYGWVSLDVPSLDKILADSDKKITVGAKIGGTLKSYNVGFIATVTPDGKNVLIGGFGTQ